jgi:hypothetical protein
MDLIQGDQKSPCTWWLQYRKLQVMFKVSPASLQTSSSIWLLGSRPPGPGDTRLTPTPSVISNSNYVIMVSEWNCLKYFCVFLYCNYQVHRDFLITLYKRSQECVINISKWQAECGGGKINSGFVGNRIQVFRLYAIHCTDRNEKRD